MAMLIVGGIVWPFAGVGWAAPRRRGRLSSKRWPWWRHCFRHKERTDSRNEGPRRELVKE